MESLWIYLPQFGQGIGIEGQLIFFFQFMSLQKLTLELNLQHYKIMDVCFQGKKERPFHHTKKCFLSLAATGKEENTPTVLNIGIMGTNSNIWI